MTIEEFKAWLDGFSESFPDGAPTKAQWEKIKQRLTMIGTSKVNRPNAIPMFGV